MENQLKLLGLSIDWEQEISTCDPQYYKHQQELFIDFYNHGLSQEKKLIKLGLCRKNSFS